MSEERFHALVPMAARASILAVHAYALWWLSGCNKYGLITAALFYFWFRGSSVVFGAVHGSAEWVSTSRLMREGWLDGDGPPLGRWEGGSDDYGRWEAIKRLLLWPWHPQACDNVVRHFVTAMSGGRIDLPASGLNPMVTAKEFFSILTIGSPGSGKSVGCAIPCLLRWRQAIICLDLKAELWSATHRFRRTLGGAVLALNPLGARDPKTGEDIISAYINALDIAAKDDPHLIDITRVLALALVPRDPNVKDPHWDTSATALVQTLLLAVCLFEKEERNIPTVKRILYHPVMLRQALKVMAESDALGGVASDMAKRFLVLMRKGEKEWASILSSAQKHLDFLNSPMVAQSLTRTSFSLEQIASKKISLYIIIEPHFVEAYASLLRLYLSTLLLVATRAGASEKHLTMYLLDEVTQLGRFEILRKALETGRGFGLRFWWLTQGLGALETAYPQAEYKTLLNCFGIQQYMGTNSHDTAKYVSECLGKMTQIGPSVTEGWNISTGGQHISRANSGSRSRSSHARDLLSPDEVLRAEDVIILRQSKRPLRAAKLYWYNDPELNPDVPAAAAARPSLASYAICGMFLCAVLYLGERQMSAKLWARNAIHAFKQEPMEKPKPPMTREEYEAKRRQAILASQTIPLRCQRCQATGSVPGTLAGVEVACEVCSEPMIVPSPTQELSP